MYAACIIVSGLENGAMWNGWRFFYGDSILLCETDAPDDERDCRKGDQYGSNADNDNCNHDFTLQ